MKSILIGIAGGTGSGKSTFTNRIRDAFGDEVAVIYHDNYYKAHYDMPFEERKKLNYDHPDAFDTDLLLQDLKKLKAGEAIISPTYNYADHNRAEATVRIEPRRVILLEGILALYDKRLRTSRSSWMRTQTSGSSEGCCGTPRSGAGRSKTSSISTSPP